MINEIKIPKYITFFLPIVSDNFPENGREIPAEIENKEMIKPLCSAPPKFEMNPFNSGKIKLKLAMKKNIERQSSQKFLS